MNRNIRCYICNFVSNQEICDETSPLRQGSWYDDGTGFLCSVCLGDPDDDDEYDDGLIYFYEDEDDFTS